MYYILSASGSDYIFSELATAKTLLLQAYDGPIAEHLKERSTRSCADNIEYEVLTTVGYYL